MPPDRFEVDLTSVCVRRGAVQLPFRLKDAFSEGAVAAVDADGGAALELAFHPPRELAGLGPFFEAHAVRPNDCLALVFTDDGLELQAIRRERGGARSGAGRAPAAAGGSRSAPPATASPGGAPGASESSSPTAGDDSAPRSAASPTPPSLRLEVPRTSEPAAPGDAPVRDVSPRWRPLDVTAHGEEDRGGEAAGEGSGGKHDIGRVVVREVRRSRAASPADGWQAPERQGDARSEDSGGNAAGPSRHEPARQPAREAGNAGLFGLARRLGRGRGAARGASRDAIEAEDVGSGAASGATARPAAEVGARETQPSAGAADDPQAVIHRAGGDAELVVEHAPSARSSEPRAAGKEVAVAGTARDAHGGAEADAVSAVDEQAWEPEALRADIAAVRSYLGAPGVPAIVRTERVAEALGVSVGRAERALERVSEEWEHLSRIRAGAYMLRRPSED